MKCMQFSRNGDIRSFQEMETFVVYKSPTVLVLSDEAPTDHLRMYIRMYVVQYLNDEIALPSNACCCWEVMFVVSTACHL